MAFWKSTLLALLLLIGWDSVNADLLDPETEAEVRAPILGLFTATGIAISLVPGRKHFGQAGRYAKIFAETVDGGTSGIIAVTGWLAAQQWLLSVSQEREHTALMVVLGLLAGTGVYAGILARDFRGDS